MNAVRYLLDTNICIFIRQSKSASALARFRAAQPGEIAMSVITFGELRTGVHKSQHPAQAESRLAALRAALPVLDMDEAVGEHYALIRAHLEKNGERIGNNDLWIAAHARARDLTVVTNNTGEFARVPGLKLEDWS